METIGSRLVLLLLLVTVAAAAILAGRGTDPADEIRLAGKAEDLLGDGGSAEQKEASGSKPPVAPAKPDDVPEPAMSYAEFIARSEGNDEATDEPTDEATAETATPRAPVAGPGTAHVHAAPASDQRQGEAVALTSPSGEAMREKREPDAAGEPLIGANFGQRANAGGDANAVDAGASTGWGPPRVAEAGVVSEHDAAAEDRRMINEPSESIGPSSPEGAPGERAARAFKPAEAPSEAASGWSMPINPYDANPYVPRQTEPSGEQRPAEPPAPQASQGSNYQGTDSQGTNYQGTDSQQGVRWERYLPTSEPITEPSGSSPEAPAATPGWSPETDHGLQSPSDLAPANRELAGPAPTGRQAYPPSPRGPAGMTMPGSASAPAGAPAGNPYGSLSAPPAGGPYDNPYGNPAANPYDHAYGHNDGNPSGTAPAARPGGNRDGAATMPYPQAGGFAPDDPSVPQQAVSPYDTPRR